jgi:PAS domain S-box-containing protein
LRFNQRLLEAALENMSQGISVVDRELRLVAWNARYAEMFGFPEDLLEVGRPVAEITRWTLHRFGTPEVQIETALHHRLAHMRAGTPHLTERVFPDGSIVEIRGNPMPGGGFVATFTDVTAFRRTEAELIRSNETLEQRVDERTASLDQAKREAERANEAKSRFLTAVGHDLLQPLHAAQLFTDALAQQLDPARRASLGQIRGALDSTTDLLTGLFDMARLEAGGLLPQARVFPVSDVLDPLASEFRALAAERGLRFDHVPTAAWTHSDPQLLRRVLQNFLANAVRYTQRGRVLFGVRRVDGALRIEVHDTGPGIAADQQALIFEEFRRGDGVAGQGLGLGLAIADRIARLLEAKLALRSRVGRGTVFALTVPCVSPQPYPASLPVTRTGLAGAHVLVVDNEALALDALRHLLEGWGCSVDAAADGDVAEHAMVARDAALWLFDYHLDAGDTGLALHERLRARFGERPTLILSADATDHVRRYVADQGLGLLQKPVRPLALKSVLDRLLATRPL